MSNNTLYELAEKGDYESLESEWMNALEADPIPLDNLVQAIALVFKAGQRPRAETLASTALSAIREKLEPDQALEPARQMLFRAPDSDDLRNGVADLYRTVYADNHAMDRALDLSALLSGGKVRKAVRTLDICLHLKPGAYFLNRFNEQAAEILELDDSTYEVIVRTNKGRQTLGPDQLAADYDPIDPDDFRALCQLHPEKVTELLDTDPLTLVIGMIRGHNNRMNSEQLKHALCPTFLTADKWSRWWTKARNVIRKSPNVVLEGKNPIVLTYDSAGRSLEDEVWPGFEKTFAPDEILQQVNTYLREAKSRGQEPSQEMLARLGTILTTRIPKQLVHSAAEALGTALVYQIIADAVELPQLEKSAGDILAEADDPARLIAELPSDALWPQAIELLDQRRPDDLGNQLASLLPVAPTALLDDIVRRLDDADRLEAVIAFIGLAQSDPVRYVDALAWLWRSPKLADKLPIPSRFDQLMKLLNAADTIYRHADAYPKDLTRDARAKIRTTLTLGKLEPFEEAIEGIEPGMALAIRTQIDRADTFSTKAGQQLRSVINEKFPGLDAAEMRTYKPWEDQNTIFVTAGGFARKEKELHELVHVKMKENAVAIGAAIEHGDLSENSEYKFALEERDLLQARMRQMQQQMAKARVIRPDDVVTVEVSVGTLVTLEENQTGKDMTISILGPWESDIDRGVYNYNAPLCQGLLGHKLGETVSLTFGEGTVPYTIKSIAVADFQ